MEKIWITLRVLTVGKINEIPSPHGVQRVMRCMAGDETGAVALMLWNKRIEEYGEVDLVLEISNAVIRTYKGEKQLVPTRSSTITKIEDELFPSSEKIKKKFGVKENGKEENQTKIGS